MLGELLLSHLDAWENHIAHAQAEIDAAGTGGRADTKSRTIVHDEKYIYVHLKRNNVDEIFTYSEDLFLILSDHRLCTFYSDCSDNFRGRLHLRRNEKFASRRQLDISLGKFASLYYVNSLSVEQFMSELPRLREEMDEKGNEVDHLNSDFHNHCRWNLSEVSNTTNHKKNSLAADIKPPHYCNMVSLPGGGYRIKAGWIVPGHNGHPIGEAQYIYCPSAEALVSYLKSFRANCRASGMSDVKEYYGGIFEVADRAAKELLSKDDSDFVQWEG